jgi:hypothetical protein
LDGAARAGCGGGPIAGAAAGQAPAKKIRRRTKR